MLSPVAASVVSIGEMLAQFCQWPGRPLQSMGFGGDSLAVVSAVAHIAAKHGLDVRTQYYTAVGPAGDPASEAAVDFIRKQGVGAELVQRLPGRTVGTFVVNYDAAGRGIPDPQTGERYTFVRRDSAATQMMSSAVDPGVLESLATNFDCVYLSLISIAVLCHRPGTRGAGPGEQEALIDILAKARSSGKTTALGTNLRSGLWGFRKGAELAHPQKREALRVLRRSLEHADLVLSNIDDEQELIFCGEGRPQITHARRMHDAGARAVVITDGPRDILVSWTEGASVRREWLPVTPVPEAERGNEAGLGDAFAGGFLLGQMLGKTPPVSARIGSLMGAAALRSHGAIVSRELVPRMDALLAAAAPKIR